MRHWRIELGAEDEETSIDALAATDQDPFVEPNEVVNALMTGRYDDISAAGDANFRRSVPAAELQRVWLAMTEKFGQPTAADPGVVVHDLDLRFKNGQGHMQVAYRNGDIVGVVLRPGAPTGRFGQ